MKGRPRFHFVQERGPWIARCKDPLCEAVLGTTTLPVMRDFRDGQWSWGKTVSFNGNPDQFGHAWWNDPAQEKWRELLVAGLPLLVRRATAPTAEAPTGSVGTPIGIFRTRDVVIETDRMTLTLTERLAEAS